MKAQHNTIYSSLKRVTLLLFVLFTGYALGAQNFRDNLANDSIGEWPRNWDVVNGSVRVSPSDLGNAIDFDNKAIIKPILNGQVDNYLGDKFTIEFDAYFGDDIFMNRQNYQIRLWDGSNYHKGNVRMVPISIQRNGAKTMVANPNERHIENYTNHTNPKNLYNAENHTYGEVWRHITLSYDNGYVKLFIDEEQIFIIPRIPIKPNMFSLGAYEYTSDTEQRFTAITNIKLSDKIIVPEPTPIPTEPEDTENESTTSNEPENEWPENAKTATYKFKFDWLVVYEANDGIGNNLLELWGGGGFSIGISSETIRNENQLAKISYSNPYQIGKNDGSLLPQDEIYIEINSSDYGYDSIKELEEDLTLNINYWMGEKDPRFGSIEPPSDMHSDKTMKVSEALKAEPLSMNDVVSARNQNLPGVLKFQQKSNRMAVSFSFEKIN